MFLYFSIYLILTQLISIQAKEVPFSKYRDLLTKNYSKRWLLHMSERQSTTNPYCNICCLNITGGGVMKDCGFHTMCVYKKDKPRHHCRGFMAVKFTEGEKYMILDAHNTVRNKVASGEERRGSKGPQPMAGNMRRLEWDDELTRIAEMWVSQCSATHDRCRDVERFPVGQNIAVDYASKSNHLQFIKTWFDAVERFNPASIPSYSPHLGKNVEEYTQLVWAESYKVGCARAAFQSDPGPDVVYREIMACNYGPAGNIPGQPIYIKGSPCTACLAGTQCDTEYPSLCDRARHLERTDREGTQKHISEEGGGSNREVADANVLSLGDKKNYNGAIVNFNIMSGIYTISTIMLYN